MNLLSKMGGVSVTPFFFMSEDVGSLSAIRGFTRDSIYGALESGVHHQSQKISDT